MRKSICTVIATILTICSYAQEIKVKNDEVKLDDKTVAYITGKKPSLQILSLDKQYTVNAELKFLESSGKRWMVLKSLKTEKTNEVDYKKFNPLNQQKSVIEAFIDKGFLSADGLNIDAIENFINGASSGVADKIKGEATAAIEKKNSIANLKISIDDAGAIFSGSNNKIGTIKIAQTTSAGIQKYEVLDLDNYVIATWYNMSSKHPGYDKFLYEELITFDGKVIKVKPDTFGTLQYKMSTDKTALNIVGELLSSGYVLQHQGTAAEQVKKEEKLKADQEIAALAKEADNRIYEQKPFAMDAKKAIRIIEYALEAHATGKSFSSEAQYITENNKIVGKKYPSHATDYGYYELRLNFEGNLIKNASIITRYSNKPILLEFQNNTITRIIYKDYSVDFKLQYDANKVTLFSKEGEAEVTYVLELDGDRTKSVVETVKFNKPFSKPYISKTGKFSFTPDSYTLDYTSYKREKAAEEKNILQKIIYRYSKVSNNVYKLEYLENGLKEDKSKGLVIIFSYDDFDRIYKEESTSNYGKSLTNYFYSDNKSYDYVKKISVSENVKGKETNISIVKDMPKTNATVNDYEWRQGYYTLDANSDLVFENRDGKHRQKVNGIWSDWKYNEM
ncbi:hypothetical protein ACHRVZ_01780 [Flavobacterium sp. FlaQc-57]|uniref:hypothetical protein n=1 Tax=Flavobacterium sp. FlaQc-57 TaxID=3374186 RepID=UPI0037567D9B